MSSPPGVKVKLAIGPEVWRRQPRTGKPPVDRGGVAAGELVVGDDRVHDHR
jgi:hypothetical protein